MQYRPILKPQVLAMASAAAHKNGLDWQLELLCQPLDVPFAHVLFHCIHDKFASPLYMYLVFSAGLGIATLTLNVIASMSPQSGELSPRFFMSSLRSSWICCL